MSESSSHVQPWARVALWRRGLLAFLVLIPSAVASEFVVGILPHPGFAVIDDALAVVFGLLFGWVSIGLWTSVFGVLVLLFGSRHWVSLDAPEPGEMTGGARTAVVMPAYREQPERVVAGLEAMYRSLREVGRAEGFDFFLLSDSDDPDAWIEEEIAWIRLRERLGGNARVFYRRRRSNIKRKSGNIADFCRRWGAEYDFMVVLDADSLMSGETLASLADAMCAHPDVGLIQTVPSTVHQNTLFGRLQQFANRLYGPVFSAGMHFLQLGEGHYWGHNAIIRIEPFMRHCALPRLSGKTMLGGEILSHDFVEAALMRRAGWSVWVAHDLSGSYEETPPTLLDELKRDRRWAQGNLQHARLLFASGLNPAHRAIFVNGIMAYVSSLLWFVFLLLSSIESVLHVLIPPDYFPDRHVLFPVWPVWHPHWAVVLAGFTLAILFLPKLLALLLTLLRGRAGEFGGVFRLIASALLESLLSIVLAPIRMLFHTIFVLSILLGRQVRWGTQARGDTGTSWHDALRYHALGTLLGVGWASTVFLLNPGYFWWLIPVMGAWVIVIPVSVWTSRSQLGIRLRRSGLLLTPEEVSPPALLALFQSILGRLKQDGSKSYGFLAAVVDPGINAMHCTLLGKDAGSLSEEVALSRRRLLLDALKQGPHALDRNARMALLTDGAALRELHWGVWSLREDLARHWGLVVG